MLRTTVLLQETCHAARTSWHAAFTGVQKDKWFFLFTHYHDYLATMNLVFQDQFRWKRMFIFSGLCVLWNPGALNENPVSVEQPVSDRAAKLSPWSWSPWSYKSHLAGKIQTKVNVHFLRDGLCAHYETQEGKILCLWMCSWQLTAQQSDSRARDELVAMRTKCHPTTCRIAKAEYTRRFNYLDRAGGALIWVGADWR